MLDHAHRLDPRCAIVFLVEGMIALANGQLASATDRFRAAIELKGDLVDAHHGLAQALQASGEREEAIAAYRVAVRLNPAHAEAHTNLGSLLRAAGLLEAAAESHRAAIHASPKYAAAHFNLGNALRDLDFPDKAIESYRQALGIEPDFVGAHVNLAELLCRLGRREEAMPHFDRAVALRPDDETLRYLANTQREGVESRMPAALVRDEFNAYAGVFDSRLRETLEYRAPEILAEALRKRISPAVTGGSILDMGCGTGLLGPFLRPFAGRLVGVDLSGAMLARARERGCYDDLIEADLVDYLASQPGGSLGIITAADVLVYLGDLGPVFSRASYCLHERGIFAFSVEAGNDEELPGYGLRRTGRFTHSRTYIETLGRQHGFRSILIEENILRKEQGENVKGLIVVCSRAPE